MKDRSRPGDRKREVEAERAAELRLAHLIEHQRANREQLRRQGAADALYGGGDMMISRD